MNLTIGKLAEAAGVGVETVRFYERKGLVRQPTKAGGFRHYDDGHAAQIRFIKRAQELGFSLQNSKEILELQAKCGISGAQVRAKAQRKIEEIRLKMADLKRMEASLTRLAQVCGHGTQAARACPIFECFQSEEK